MATQRSLVLSCFGRGYCCCFTPRRSQQPLLLIVQVVRNSSPTPLCVGSVCSSCCSRRCFPPKCCDCFQHFSSNVLIRKGRAHAKGSCKNTSITEISKFFASTFCITKTFSEALPLSSNLCRGCWLSHERHQHRQEET